MLSTRGRLFRLGPGIFWLSLSPVSNFIPIYRPMANRFLYLPMTGVTPMLASARFTHPESLRAALTWEEAELEKLRPIARRNLP